MKIMIDVDDVLADFNGAFIDLSHELFGTPKDVEITEWDFYRCIPGLTREMEQEVWNIIKNRENFYETLKPFAREEDFSLLREVILSKRYEIFFVTSRFPVRGRSVEEQTCRWIKRHIGGSISPLVYVTSKKGALCEKMNISIALDDAPHHIDNLICHGISVVVMDWPHNRQFVDLPRVKNLKEFFHVVENWDIICQNQTVE